MCRCVVDLLPAFLALLKYLHWLTLTHDFYHGDLKVRVKLYLKIEKHKQRQAKQGGSLEFKKNNKLLHRITMK